MWFSLVIKKIVININMQVSMSYIKLLNYNTLLIIIGFYYAVIIAYYSVPNIIISFIV